MSREASTETVAVSRVWDPPGARTEKSGSTVPDGDSTASEARIPKLGVAGMDDIISAIVTG